MMDPLPDRGLSSKGMRWLFMVRWMLMIQHRPSCHRCFMGGLAIYPRSAKPWPQSVTVIHPYCPLHSGSPMVARPPVESQPLEQLVPPDLWVVTDHQLGAIDNMDPGSLATGIMEQEVKGQQELQHQGHKPCRCWGDQQSSGPTPVPGHGARNTCSPCGGRGGAGP